MTYTLKELQTILEKINPYVDWNRILDGYPELLTEDQVVHYVVTSVPIPKELLPWRFTADEINILRIAMKLLQGI